MLCYICNKEFKKPVTNYPDGKNPCPTCVESYREFSAGSDEEVFSIEDTERMEQLELFSFPAVTEDYYE